MASKQINYTAQEINTRLGKVSTLESDVTKLNDTSQTLENKDIELEKKIKNINEDILPLIENDISDLSNRITNWENNPAIQDINTDWNEEDENSNNYIANKPPITNGEEENSLIINDGATVGKYAIAGGTIDFNLIKNVTNNQISEESIELAIAEGAMSVAYGPSTKALTTGSVAFGTASIAGCKGFYWHKIDFTNKTVTLSTEQNPYYKDSNGVEYNTQPTWNPELDGQLLAQWEINDLINITEVTIHQSLKATITGIDATNGVITLNKIPFTNKYINENEINNYFIQNGISNLDFQDLSVNNPSKPKAGVVEYGVGSYANGLNCKSTGLYSHAFGRDNLAVGNSAFVEGRSNKAGYCAHAEGRANSATGDYSHAEGNGVSASGQIAHAEGMGTIATGKGAHAEGHYTIASGEFAHSEGHYTTASGMFSHAEGGVEKTDAENNKRTVASGRFAHAEGEYTTANGRTAHAEGQSTTANGAVAHAEGGYTEALGQFSHAEGLGTTASKNYQHVQGKYNIKDDTVNGYAHILGNGNSDTTRSNAHTIDWDGNAWFAGDVYIKGSNQTTGSTKLATTTEINNAINTAKTTHYVTAGQKAGTALGSKATAEGGDTTASGTRSHAEGSNTVASGVTSHAEGENTKAKGAAAHAEGYDTEAAYHAHAEGDTTKANAQGSHAEGIGTVAYQNGQHVEGRFNDYESDIYKKYIHVVGNGTSDTERSNAHTIDLNGNAWFAGNITVGNDKKELATKEYANDIKNDLLNGAGKAYDTLKELGELIDDNADAIDALEIVATGKADKNHNHNDLYYTESEIDNKIADVKSYSNNNLTNAKLYTDNAVAQKSQVQIIESDVTEVVSTLKIQKVTQEEYDTMAANGKLEDHVLYLTPDDNMDLSEYATVEQLNTKASIEQLNTKADSEHIHDDRYYKESEIDEKIVAINNTISNSSNEIKQYAESYSNTNLYNSKLYTDNAVAQRTQVQIITWEADD